MASKRPFHDEEEEEEEERGGALVPLPKRMRPWDLFGEVICHPVLAGYLESMLRRVVQEEFQKSLLNRIRVAPRTSIYKILDVARFQLHFKNKMPHTLFTKRRITADDKKDIQIVIKDVNSNEITSYPLSSLMIKIVVVSGDFGGDGQTEWSKDEFDSHILAARDGKRPLLVGELSFRLENGVGSLIDATFTDNSHWTRSGKFRLGAFVSDHKYRGERVQEAVTEAFKVKDGRVEPNQKDHPPSLSDKVCCLKKIQKGGVFHKKLLGGGITTVQEFLRSYILDRDTLRSLLGSGMSDKWWEETIKHALQCECGNKHYLYHVADTEIVLIFNSIFELVGEKADGLYRRMDELSESRKVILNNFKNLAYKNSRDIVEFSDTLDDNFPRSYSRTNVTSVPGSSLSDPHNSNLQVTFHDMPSSQAGFHGLPSAAVDELPSDVCLPIFHPLHKSASTQKPGSSHVSNDKSCSLSTQMPIIQAPVPAGTQMYSEVLSNEQSVIVVQRSASFGTNRSDPEFFFDELLQFQPDEELMELLHTIREESRAPLSPRMLKKLITVVKWLAIIKRPVARRARIVHHNSGVNARISSCDEN